MEDDDTVNPDTVVGVQDVEPSGQDAEHDIVDPDVMEPVHRLAVDDPDRDMVAAWEVELVVWREWGC